MQVNVLVRDGYDEEVSPLLILPFGSEASIPEHLRAVRWRELATATTDDPLLWPDQSSIEADIQATGYAFVTN